MRQRGFIWLLRISASHGPCRALNAVATDAGICPISLHNRLPDFVRDIDATQRQASVCRGLT
jgi:hypothetical protein